MLKRKYQLLTLALPSLAPSLTSALSAVLTVGTSYLLTFLEHAKPVQQQALVLISLCLKGFCLAFYVADFFFLLIRSQLNSFTHLLREAFPEVYPNLPPPYTHSSILLSSYVLIL